ncbi:hypothetical protein EYZ11_006254 [Aspergillus tanneri]|uniref:Uncharacterized protein n=1 Tax=Aspergillus tanneri TaxID=1220188 RepID=A0A4S3JLV7_9EURO|nr:hypothetical protein EYZ11_006254 [Aspergillus tanneri]
MLLPVPISRYSARLRSLNRLRSTFEARSSNGDGNKALSTRLVDVLLRTWDLGFTAFGGPAVHFQILHARFVEGKGGKEKWVDEQTVDNVHVGPDLYKFHWSPRPRKHEDDLLSGSIACGLRSSAARVLRMEVIPGPGDRLVRHPNLPPSSLPGAIAMYALSLGVQRISETLPLPVYALLSGLNAATVGIIALAAVQLAEKAIRDKLTRIQVIFGACAGVCYNTLWYFPLLMVIGGLASVVWDGWMNQRLRNLAVKWRSRGARRDEADQGESAQSTPLEATEQRQGRDENRLRSRRTGLPTEQLSSNTPPYAEEAPSQDYIIRVRVGVILFVLFFGKTPLER